MSERQLQLIKHLLATADSHDIPVWLSGGWAIDARLGKITRDHDDIDLTFAADRKEAFHALIAGVGAQVTARTDYGFLAEAQGFVLDCEPAQRVGDAYEIEGAPPGSCPMEKEGTLDGRRLRCNSWEAILWDYFYYASEVPAAQWAAKHVRSYEQVCQVLGDEKVTALRNLFESRHEKE